MPGEAAEDIRKYGIRSIVAAPVFVGGVIWGALAVGTTSAAALPEGVEDQLTGFADLVSLAVSNAQAWESLLQSRARTSRRAPTSGGGSAATSTTARSSAS